MLESPPQKIIWRQLFLLLILSILMFFTHKVQTTEEFYLVYAAKIVEFIVILLIGRILYSIVLHKIYVHYEHKYKKPPPNLVINVLQFLSLFFTSVSIVIIVFNESAVSIMALGGVVGAGIALGVTPLVLDAFSGLVHEIENGFEIGDWIELDDKKIGQVKSISWRIITLETLDHTIIIIPQRKISDGFMNLSRPLTSITQTLEISLDHEIPIDRAERLLTGIVSVVDGVQGGNCTAWALEANEGGITYAVRYLISDYKDWREIRHKVLEAITRQVHQYGLKLSETIGQYGLLRGEKEFKEAPPLSPNLVLSKVDLFSTLPKTAFDHLCKQAQKHTYKRNEYIVQQGDVGESLFVVAEGSAEVSMKSKGSSTTIAFLPFGSYFGEMSLLTGNRRAATVRAFTNCVVYEVKKSDLAPILKQDKKIIDLLAKKAEERHLNLLTLKRTKQKKDKKDSDVGKLVNAIRNYFGL